MKIGILADIHAQLDSLQKALAIFERETVDKIICAGDIVEKDFDGDAVVRLLQAKRIPCVRGNHDEAAVTNQRWFRQNMDADVVHETLKRLGQGDNTLESRLLTDETIFYLQTLPFERRFVWEGQKILLVHGSPNSNTQYLVSNMPDSFLRHIVEDVNADIIICGHSHSPMRREVDNILLINSGSVCKSQHPRESHTCGILTLPERDFHIFSLDSGHAYPY